MKTNVFFLLSRGVCTQKESTCILNTICKLLWGIFEFECQGKVIDFLFMEKAWGKQDFLFKTNYCQIQLGPYGLHLRHWTKANEHCLLIRTSLDWPPTCFTGTFGRVCNKRSHHLQSLLICKHPAAICCILNPFNNTNT